MRLPPPITAAVSSAEYTGISAATIETSCKNHMIVFAAEESRESGKIVDVAEYSSRYGM